jgi:hypothetical protein
MPLTRCTLLPYLCLALVVVAVRAADTKTSADEETLHALGLATDGPGLLEFFRKRTLKETDRERIAKLIRQLGDDEFEVRQKASTDLLLIGPVAVPFLQQAAKDPDVEVARRAERCLKQIDMVAGSAVILAAARVLAEHKPAGAAEALLNFLPDAGDDAVSEEIGRVLAQVALREGKPEQVLVEALTDKRAVKRLVAAEALARAGGPEFRAAVRKLLADPDISVRLRVALVLLELKERDAVPVLISLLAEVPGTQSFRIEDQLFRLAGDKPPTLPNGSTEAARRLKREAWAAWWKEQGPKLDLAKLDLVPHLLGHTVMVVLPRSGLIGKVVEIDAQGKQLWQIDQLKYPIDVQVLPGDKVLITEYTGRLVTERNFKGEILWQHQPDGPVITARRLANGNVFVATRTKVYEVTRDNKEVWSVTRNDSILAATRLRDGQVAVVTSARQLVRMDMTGKELHTIALPSTFLLGSNVEELANGRFLLSAYNLQKVVEIDRDGKIVWEAAAQSPGGVMRLPNGNTLITSRVQSHVVEVDRTGKQVWEHQSDGRPIKAVRR